MKSVETVNYSNSPNTIQGDIVSKSFTSWTLRQYTRCSLKKKKILTEGVILAGRATLLPLFKNMFHFSKSTHLQSLPSFLPDFSMYTPQRTDL